jgi:RNA polymerase sigma factor for flagellar operon FliA
MLFRDHAPSAEDRLTQDRMKRLLAQAIGNLPEREAMVLQLYYVEELNVYEIAEVLKVTTGRVSQIKKAAVERLRTMISAELAD